MAQAEVKEAKVNNFGDPWERMSDQENSDDSAEICTCHLSDDEKVQQNLVGQMLLRESEEACTSASAPEVVVYQPPRETLEEAEDSRPPAEKTTRTPQLSPLSPAELPDTHIGLAWLVTLCFNLPLGIVAICMSMKAAKLYIDGKCKQGQRYTRLSLYASLGGIVLTVVIVMSVILYLAVKEAADRRKRLSG